MDEDKNPKLMDLCNLKTIQEDSRGFFNSLLENITTNTRIREWTEDIWKERLFGEDFIRALIKQEDIFRKITETFTVSEVYRKKCERTASVLLIEAEELWKIKKWQLCRERCSQALLKAAVTSPNSSAASETNTGSVRQCALLLRSRCLLKEGRIHLAKTDLNSCLQQGPLQDSSKKELREIFQEIQKLNLKPLKNSENIVENSPSIHPSAGKHETLPSASKLIFISESAEQGRFLSAAEDIGIGDNLVVEQPYAACLNPQNFGTHCHHCFKRLEAPFGCPECATVAFCSENCSSAAISTYHQYECKFMDLFIGSGMSVLCHIALRMVTQIGLNETITTFKKYLTNKYSKDKNDTLTSKESDDNMSQHDAVYKLCTHEQYRQPEDYIRRILMAFFLTRCLQKTSFFPSKDIPIEKQEFGSDEISVWCVLLFNLQVLQFNAHQVCGLRGDTNLGCALYITAALFNHDCCPSVTRFFLGKQLVIKALRPVLAGDVVGDSYGPQWGRSRTEGVKAIEKAGAEDRESRQRALRSRYWFLCKCRACSQQWPLPPSPSPNIRCSQPKCGGSLEENSQSAKCTICKKVVTMDHVKQKHDALKKCLEKIQDGEAIPNKEQKLEPLTEALMEYGQLTHRPCPISLHAEDTIRSCYAAILSSSSSL